MSLEEDQSILRLFENINIKLFNIINSRKTNLKLIENLQLRFLIRRQ